MDAEKALLSHLHDVVAISQCWDKGARGGIFENPLHRQIFEFIIEYWHDNAMKLAPTPDVIGVEFPGYVSEASGESLTWLVDHLKKRYIANETQQLIRTSAETITTDPVSSVRVLNDGAWLIRQEISDRISGVDLAANISERRLRYTDKISKERKNRPAILGITEVDEYVGGIYPGELALMVAATKTGKSFALVHAAVEARRKGFTPIIFTLEQSIQEFEDRADAFMSEVSYGRIQRGEMLPPDLKQLHAAQEEFKEMGPLYIEKPPRGERTVPYLVNRARQVGANYLIIDQLSHMDAMGKRNRDVREDQSEIIYDLKDEIGRADSPIPCLMAVQFNRAATAVKGERGRMQNIANSSEIERTADLIFGLYRSREIRQNNAMVLDVLGSRRTDEKSWLLDWQLESRTSIAYRQDYTE